MVLGSHNSWSYLRSKKWWMAPFTFMAKCQSVDIRTQYSEYGVRCFDVRVRFDDQGQLILAHGFMQYKYTKEDIMRDLRFLDGCGNCFIRILHEARNKQQYTEDSKRYFKAFCQELEETFKSIHFWCGRNLYDWQYDYNFKGLEPSCEERYSSVTKPYLIDDWFPWIYAKLNNQEIIKEGTEKAILLIDFVNIR